MQKKTKIGIALVICIFIIFGMGYMLESNTNKYNKLQEDNKKITRSYKKITMQLKEKIKC